MRGEVQVGAWLVFLEFVRLDWQGGFTTAGERVLKRHEWLWIGR